MVNGIFKSNKLKNIYYMKDVDEKKKQTDTQKKKISSFSEE